MNAPSSAKRTPRPRFVGLFLYGFSLSVALLVLLYARQAGLLPMPEAGMDQEAMLKAAAGIYQGTLPGQGYLYSPLYTAFLTLLVAVSGGDLVTMRILQAALCALTPVFIYKTCLLLRFGWKAGAIAASLFCFYAPAALLALDFLREGPLALCFVLYVHFTAKAFARGGLATYAMAGVAAGLCVLGRENFLPVVLSPLLLLCLKEVRARVDPRQALTGLLAFAACVSPVLFYNYARFGSFSVIPGALDNMMKIIYGRKAEVSGDFLMAVASNVSAQAANFVSSYEIPNSLSIYAHSDIILFLAVLFVPFNLFLASAAVALAARPKRLPVAFLLILSATYMGSMLCFHIFYRYRFPFVPALAMLSGYGVYLAAYRMDGMRRAAALLLAAAVFALTYNNPDRLRPDGERLAVVRVLLELGRLSEAERGIARLRDKGVDTTQLEARLRAQQQQMPRSGGKQ